MRRIRVNEEDAAYALAHVHMHAQQGRSSARTASKRSRGRDKSIEFVLDKIICTLPRATARKRYCTR